MPVTRGGPRGCSRARVFQGGAGNFFGLFFFFWGGTPKSSIEKLTFFDAETVVLGLPRF